VKVVKKFFPILHRSRQSDTPSVKPPPLLAPIGKNPPMTKQDYAENIALQALGWLVGNDDLLPVFLGATGASLGDLAQSAGQPAFLGSVLDFLLMDDAWVIAFCDAENLPYLAPIQARTALPGGEQTHWT
jgi:hypothetical protein